MAKTVVRVPKTCSACGKLFSILPSMAKQGSGKYCSRVCEAVAKRSRARAVASTPTKICPHCLQEKDRFHFLTRSGMPRSLCLACTNIKAQAHNVKKKYGISMSEYLEFLSKPCSICGAPSTDLDHCHKTGRIRGGLCHHHNAGLGLFRDSPTDLRAAADYLENNQQEFEPWVWI